MWTIEVCVGRKFGMWKRSARLFPDREGALAYMDSITAAERRAIGKGGEMWRRAVRL